MRFRAFANGTAAAVAALLGLSGPAGAIAINDAGAPGYVTGAGSFSGVAKVTYAQGGSSFLCSAALLADGIHLITAGHCVAGASGWQVTFETPSGTTTMTAAGADLHPQYAARPAPLGHLSEFDVGILTLAGLAPADATRYDLAAALPDPVSATAVDIVGYGRGGSPDGHLAFGERRRAANAVDFVVGWFDFGTFIVDAPDLPLAMTVVFGPGTAADEGMVAVGDSGGPVLVGNTIVGITSTTSIPRPPDPMLDGVLYLALMTNVTEASIADWLAAVLAVPAPPALPAAAGALLLLAASRLRARRRPPRSRS